MKIDLDVLTGRRRRRLRGRRTHKLAYTLAAMIVALVAWAYHRITGRPLPGFDSSRPTPAETTRREPKPLPPTSTRSMPDSGAERIIAAFHERRSDFFVESAGAVARLLPDDNDGSRHQCFVVELAGGHTVKIAHNIDLAERIPLRIGDPVRFRGEYEWSDRGGVMHWTHHDPAGRIRGGWIVHAGKTYK